MIRVYQRKTCPYWICQFYDRNSMRIQKTLKHLAVSEVEREEVIAEVTRDAAVEYFHLLHRQKLWGNLAARLHTATQMFTRMQDFQPIFTLREFEHLLHSENITPAPPKRASQEKRRVVSIVKKQRRKRNVRHMYRGKARTLAELSAECGLSANVIGARLRRGWPIEKALSEPIISQNESGAIGADRRWRKAKS